MIKVVELMSGEDGVFINEYKFKDVGDLTKFDWFHQLMCQGEVVKDDVEFIDNFGEHFDQEIIEEFRSKINNKGVLYEWSVEYDASYWFIEIDDQKILADMLTIDHVVIGDDVEVDCANLRKIAEAYGKVG